MSLATWKKEFYPTPAYRVSKAKAVEHSLKKWGGLTKKELNKHGLKRTNSDIWEDKNSFPISTDTCALCKHYLDTENGCPRCPLTIVRGGVQCDVNIPSERGEHAYGEFEKNGNPMPMISWLKVAKAYVDEFGAP